MSTAAPEAGAGRLKPFLMQGVLIWATARAAVGVVRLPTSSAQHMLAGTVASWMRGEQGAVSSAI